MTDSAVEEASNTIAGVARKVRGFAARWPAVTAALLGLITACGYPPLHAWWVALPALALFIVHLKNASTARHATWWGWVFGWAHLTLANNWIATAFTHQAKMPEVLGWIAVPLLCVYLAVYPAMAALIAHAATRLANRPSTQAASFAVFAVMFAAAWIVTEWLRSWVFTGYPWPPLGLMLLGDWNAPGLAAALPYLGTYALSGLALLLAGGLAWLVMAGRHGLAAILGAAIAIAMLFPMPVSDRQADGIRYTLVQPLIPQHEMNDGSKFEEQFQRIARLSAPGRDQSRLVLWPESSLPDHLEDGYPQRYYTRLTYAGDPEAARERIGAVIGPQSTLLAGVVNLNIGMRDDGRLGAVSARNSVIAMNGAGEITHQYAKAHLVPYGEYLPLENLLRPLGLDRLTAGGIPYIPGPGPRTLDLAEHGKAGIQICYEIVFSGQVVDDTSRPDYIFNPSNDGWFGAWGPPQHFAQARMRAIEEGLPVLRSTTTGISGVIDADGIVRQSIGLGRADAVEGVIPQAKAPTLFARMGNALPLAWAALLALLALGLPRLLALVRSRG